MSFQPDPDRIVWRMHLDSSPAEVFDALDSDAGRASFWAESADEHKGVIEFRFINNERYDGEVLERDRAQRWSVDYFGAPVVFELFGDESGGTLLVMSHDIADDHSGRCEVTAGWLNVLLPMKAAIDYGVDLSATTIGAAAGIRASSTTEHDLHVAIASGAAARAR